MNLFKKRTIRKLSEITQFLSVAQYRTLNISNLSPPCLPFEIKSPPRKIYPKHPSRRGRELTKFVRLETANTPVYPPLSFEMGVVPSSFWNVPRGAFQRGGEHNDGIIPGGR